MNYCIIRAYGPDMEPIDIEVKGSNLEIKVLSVGYNTETATDPCDSVYVTPDPDWHLLQEYNRLKKEGLDPVQILIHFLTKRHGREAFVRVHQKYQNLYGAG